MVARNVLGGIYQPCEALSIPMREELQKPSIYATEIQSRLLLEGIYTLDKLLSFMSTFAIRMDVMVG